MNEFIVVKVMNEAMLRVKKSNNQDYSINEKIKNDLQDEELFTKIDKDTAIELLKNVGVSEDKLEEMYEKLLAQKNN